MEEQDGMKVILSLNTSKSVSGSIHTRVLKTAANHCALPYLPFLTSCFNSCLDTGTFPDRLKLADIIPSFKSNAIAIGFLPVVSKVFECLIVNQLNSHA